MKPDGDTMETTEPTEDAAVAEPSSLQDNTTEEAPSQPEEAAAPSQPEEAAIDVAPETIPKGNGKPVAADSKVKPKSVSTKTQPAAKSAGPSGSRPGTSSHRTVNDVKSSANVSAAAAKKTATTTKAASAAGGVPKRPVGAAASSMVKTLSKAPDKKPVGPARTTSAAASTATNGTKPTTVNGIPKKKPVAETVARPKTTALASRAAASTASKPSTSTTSKAVGATTKPVTSAVSKTTRPTTAPSTSQPASTTSRPTTAALKPSTTTAAARTAASRVKTAPPTGRTTAAQPPRIVAAKKDVSRPTSAPVANKPLAATTAADAKKNPRPTAPVKLNTASKCSTTTKAADPKVSQTKAPTKSTLTKKPVASVLSLAQNKQPFGRSPPASPANRPIHSSTPQAKRRTKPTQAVLPFTATKKAGASIILKAAAGAQRAAGGAGAAVAVPPETQTEVTESFPQDSSLTASAPAEEETEETPPVLAQSTTLDVVPQETAVRQEAASSPPQSPVRTALPQTSTPLMETESSALLPTTQEQTPAPAEPALPPVACPPDYTEEPGYQTPSMSKALPAAAAANSLSLKVPPTNLNEEEDDDEEEEREGSQLVSVSEMSGTTQPTEESRPGSAGPVGGSAWRAGGALFSELDSEEVSGSQQGASELSAPGVLEGTESMDDLGDGSLKGAIDMEGASAGSPDFEKVPDIPANDFDEDDDFDDDRVCDMDVGSERADEPLRLRHDNDANDEEEEEEEEDEDVEMASEGVTESGLESYGNADEDDFAEDERLDNLNRVAEAPPPPPQLPSAPAAQWEQPNPFVDPWHADPEHQQLLVAVSQPEQEAGVAGASPSADPWHADSETPTQASAWLELGSAPLVPENQEAPHQSSVKDEPQDLAPMQTLAPALLSAPPMSLSSTLSSETSTPEELCDYNRDGKAQDVQAPALSPQPELDHEEAEAKTLPADEVLGGPATSPTSNPSSTSVTEDEASDTEGEAQLDDSLDTTLVGHITFDSQSPSQRCLSTVEEGEEADTVEARAGEDTMTTASNSNTQSTGESCVRSPGIFFLEELPEEAKEPCLIPQPHTPPCLAEHQYIDCGKQESDSAEPAENTSGVVPGPEEAPDPSSAQSTLQQAEENPEDVQPFYFSAICENTENSFAGFAALPQPHRRDHSAYPRTYCDLVKPLVAAPPPKLTCADLPPRNMGQKALSPQLRRLEQHQRQLLEMQLRRDQQSRPLEEAEQERKTREEEEARKKKDEAEEEIKRNKEELERKTQEQAEVAKKKEEEEEKRRRELELQQQQQELKERHQIMQWQQELQQANKEQAELLLASSVLCTIYEALENSDGEEELNPTKENEPREETPNGDLIGDERGDSSPSTESPPPLRDSPQTSSDPSQDGDSSSPCPPESPERPPPLELDWGKKVDIVQQLINQTLLLNRGGCSSLLLLPRGAGGTLSPLESSLWPSLLPPLTPPSATVTSVSSFSPEATGSSPQGEWTVVELETHH
ncbi:mucin-17-like [Trematomus bernacchii]|uniref:mucin-17-like n=1 Tax=Trematomus bernacchii TaxID=40690 RepID=UPI00146D1551|nr:mucin-17-like [Trematomus bernacchii]